MGSFELFFVLIFLVRILIQKAESYSLCFLQSMHKGFLFAPVHFLVGALAWQMRGMGRCSAQGSEEAWLAHRETTTVWPRTSYRRPSPPSWLEAVVAERRSTERKGRGNPFITQEATRLPGMGYHIFTDCSSFSLVIGTYVWQKPVKYRAERVTAKCGLRYRQVQFM